MHGEFVNIPLTRCDRLLADVRDAVLLDGNFEAVPVDGSGFRKFVFEDDADAIALLNLDGWAGADPVVAPGVDGLEGRDLSPHRFGGEAEDLYRAVHLVRQIGNVGRQ